MKHKILFFVFLSALVFTTCDMTDSREISKSERDELEKNGHFLKLVNLPLNTQVPNVFSVSVFNSFSAIAKLHNDNYILIFKEKDDEDDEGKDDNYITCTVYLPLAFLNTLKPPASLPCFPTPTPNSLKLLTLTLFRSYN